MTADQYQSLIDGKQLADRLIKAQAAILLARESGQQMVYYKGHPVGYRDPAEISDLLLCYVREERAARIDGIPVQFGTELDYLVPDNTETKMVG